MLGAPEVARSPSRRREEAVRSRSGAGQGVLWVSVGAEPARPQTLRRPDAFAPPSARVLQRGSPALRPLPPWSRFRLTTFPSFHWRGGRGLLPGLVGVLFRAATPVNLYGLGYWWPNLQHPLGPGLRAASFPPRCGLNSPCLGGSPGSFQASGPSLTWVPTFKLYGV